MKLKSIILAVGLLLSIPAFSEQTFEENNNSATVCPLKNLPKNMEEITRVRYDEATNPRIRELSPSPKKMGRTERDMRKMGANRF